MQLIFERSNTRFKSNCNILALAWMPYYDETKFRLALFDYHQKQLMNISRTSGSTALTHERDGTRRNQYINNGSINNSVRNQAHHNHQQQTQSPTPPLRSSEVTLNALNAHLSSISGSTFLNSRLAEQYQRYVYMKCGNSSIVREKQEAYDKLDDQSNERACVSQTITDLIGESSRSSTSSMNVKLDKNYGRMSDFGWLVCGNVAKMVGITLTSTVPPPIDEIDGRHKRQVVSKNHEDLISFNDDSDQSLQPSTVKPGAAYNRTNRSSSEKRERLRPDRRCVRNNYNLRGHSDEIILVRWNELYQKLATVDSKGNVLIWCKVNGKFTIQTPFYNRTKTVADFKWSNDGKTALICYTDSFILVGTSSGQRHWHSMLNLEDYHTTCASWTPDDQQLLLGVSNGNVVVINLPQSELTELVVGEANIRAMCWSSGEMNLRNVTTTRTSADSTELDVSSNVGVAARDSQSPRRPSSSAVVSHRRLSRDCSVFSRYRICLQGPSVARASSGITQANGKEGRTFISSTEHRNILAIDFANSTIKLFNGSLDDPHPIEVRVFLESYSMAWSGDGQLLAVAGFNICAVNSVGYVRCRYLNTIKFYNQRGELVHEHKMRAQTRYPITALTWAHDDRRLFVATGPHLHCARVHSDTVASLSLLSLSCIHKHTRLASKSDMIENLLRHQQANQRLLNWQSNNCPLELTSDVKQFTQSDESFGGSSSSGSGCTRKVDDDQHVALMNNTNILNYKLPYKLKLKVDELFQQTLRQPFDEQLTLSDIVWQVPKNKQRYFCTLVCYTHELLDMECGASLGHQYRSFDDGQRSFGVESQTSTKSGTNLNSNTSTSDQFRIFVLYIEHQGCLIPILKARRIGVLKPEFVIFDPEERVPRQRQKVHDLNAPDSLYNIHRRSTKQQHHSLMMQDEFLMNCDELHDRPTPQQPPSTSLDPMECSPTSGVSSPLNIGRDSESMTSDAEQYYNFNVSDKINRQNQLRLNILPDCHNAKLHASNVQQLHSLLHDPLAIQLFTSRTKFDSTAGSSSSEMVNGTSSSVEMQRAIDQYKALAVRNCLSAQVTRTSGGGEQTMKSLPETRELIRIKSNIWGTKFKLINVGNRVIRQRATLGTVSYKTSLLHLAPREIFLNLRDMSNYCALCTTHHHTRPIAFRSATARSIDVTSNKAKAKNMQHNNLIDMPLVSVSTPNTPMKSRSYKRQHSNNSNHKLLTNNSSDKVLIPVGDCIRVAPKLELNQRYKLADRLQLDQDNKETSPLKRQCRSENKKQRASESNKGFNLQLNEPVAGTSRLTMNRDTKQHHHEDDILTLSLDQGDQVRVEMSSLASTTNNNDKPEAKPVVASIDPKLNEFLDANKTLKSIQSITKLIIDLSSKADIESDNQIESKSSPNKLIKLNEDEKRNTSARYIPPDAPIHQRRTPVQPSAVDHSTRWFVRTASSATSTPLKMFEERHRRRRQYDRKRSFADYTDESSEHHRNNPALERSLSNADNPLPFHRKLTNSAKRFLDGSLRSLANVSASGYTTSEEPDSEECEPLVSGRSRLRERRKLSTKSSRSYVGVDSCKSQPCTPMRSPQEALAKLDLTNSHRLRQPSLDLNNLRTNLMKKLRNSTHWLSTDGTDSETSKSTDGRPSQARNANSSYAEMHSCGTKRSRWIHKDPKTTSQLSGLQHRSSDPSSSSSLSSSSSDFSESDEDETNTNASVRPNKYTKDSSLMRHLKNVGGHFSSAKNLAEIGKTNHKDRNKGTPMSNQKKLRKRRHQRSICRNASCCCAKQLVHLRQRFPVWNEKSKIYQLDFSSRVSVESAKNFQIDYRNELALQFGRIGNNIYSLDFGAPFNPIIAMSIGLSNLTQRLK